MKTILQNSLPVLAIISFIAALLFALADPIPPLGAPATDSQDALQRSDGTEMGQRTELRENLLRRPIAAYALAAVFAVRAVANPPKVEAENPQSPEEQKALQNEEAVQTTFAASWLSYVGRVADEAANELFYFRDTRTGRVRSIGASTSADYRLIELKDGVLEFEGPEEQPHTVEVPR